MVYTSRIGQPKPHAFAPLALRRYESLTVDDMYLLYSQLKLDDNSIFTCVGTSGKSAPPTPPANRRFGTGFSDIDEEVLQQQKMPNPVELWTAMMAASQVKNMQRALNQQKQQGGDDK
ncbi:hypothetical protein DUNSADRAFT_13821 [Dunaliella salina]|uniref:Encoded protein n=1 Tax=Dunaliella salina TaxID=3046 RepID=A0ABQ7G8K0_DUNSA|nr:hypothetical protein DUNSADRAFT_13821 [Dunaliella salina]|eukprot:KAF5830938.1 hypothetical protein DUNSADRAFT_13821 [Dunaliella salina]